MKIHHPHLACLVDSSRDFAWFLAILTVVKVYWRILSTDSWVKNYTMIEVSHTLEDIPTGRTAAVLDHRSNTWTVGHVLDRNDRQYTVELPTGRVIHWNRFDLRPTSVESPTNTSIQYFSFSPIVKIDTCDPDPTNTDTHTVSSSPKVPTPKPIVSKTVVKPTVGIVKSSATTTSNKTMYSFTVELSSLQLNLICKFFICWGGKQY